MNKTTKASAENAQKDMLKAIFYCLLVVVIIRSFVVEPFRIPSSSMVPTLKVGDHIFVSKFSYGLSLPFTKFEFLSFAQPKRGDVVVFLWPRDESLHYVKRIVGLPGDKIELKGRDILINGKLVDKSQVNVEDIDREDKEEPEVPSEYYSETLGSVSHLIRYLAIPVAGHEGRELTKVVPKDQYFVMGDNRDESADSRSWGFVPRENIKGKAKFIWLSLDQVGAWNNLRKIRWSRCAQLIQ